VTRRRAEDAAAGSRPGDRSSERPEPGPAGKAAESGGARPGPQHRGPGTSRARRTVEAGAAADALPAEEAAALLGVKPATLYAYVSRGLVSSVGAGGRSRLYLRRDLERLRARRDAPEDPATPPAIPGSAGALRWGEPVLDSAITAIGAAGPRYRGRPAVDLARSNAPFEDVAEHLWGSPTADPHAWRPGTLGLPRRALAALAPVGTPPLAALAVAVPALAAADPGRFDLRPEASRARARDLVARMAACLGLGLEADGVEAAIAAASMALAVCRALGARASAGAVGAVNRALVLSADHELNTSAFAARVAASAGADLYACVSAGLAAWSGPRHGAAADRIEALVAEARAPDRAAATVRERQRRGEAIPGFGHPLYPAGDPRAVPLLEAAAALAPRDRGVRTLLAVIQAVRDVGGHAPSIDTGVVAVALAIGAPPGSAAGIFAIGRTAGWVAHALEQQAQGTLLRPRARYVGV
jgi:citrate synthase